MSQSLSHGEYRRSLWQLTAAPVSASVLTGDETADVCIIGAGISGLSVAYELLCKGRSVIVLEDDLIGAGMTGRTTAHISNALDDHYTEIERVLGADNARLAAASHTAAIERIEAIAQMEKIDCAFERVDGYLFNPPGETSDILDRELAAAQRAGVVVEKVARVALPNYDTGPALRFANQAQFHPIKYQIGLVNAIEAKGGRIFTGVHATSVQGGKNAKVATKSGQTITAGSVVVTTNVPINDRYVIHTKQAPYTSYVAGLAVPAGAIEHALFWDTAEAPGEDSYHYVRLHPAGDHDVLIVGGRDHKTGQTKDFEKRYDELEAWTRERFPSAGAVEYRWSGQVMEPVDMMAFIGRNPADEDNVYVTTGDSGNGITHGAIAGMLISDLITGRDNPWAKLYDPGRKSAKAVPEFLHENLNVLAQMSDYVTPGDKDSAEHIPAGHGAVIREGLAKVAVYRDESGSLHRCTAVCPHLKCIVHWNPGERTWDCPCHGSRFDALGTVITGPANSNLAPA